MDDLVRVLADRQKWESRIPWLYLDGADIPNVTTGVGFLVRDVIDAQRMPWKNCAEGGRPATPQEVAHDFFRVASMRGGLMAYRYRVDAPGTALRLLDEDITAIGVRMLRETYLPGLQKNFPGFDGYPEGVRSALFDLEWNLGVGGLAKFQALRQACAIGRWDLGAKQCHVKQAREARNAWRAEMFLQAAREAGQIPTA